MNKLFDHKLWAILMSPFSLLYKWVMQFRNYLYDIEHKAIFDFDNLIISVGNLSVGGTGKTPMVEYLIRFFLKKHPDLAVTTLSRGYGRKSKGFMLADAETNAKSIGDEPFQMYQKFAPAIDVSVCEDRVLAVPSILMEKPGNNVVLLDDAFQHRSIKPNFSIVLSDYARPFYNDYVLPSGLLREGRKGINRADVLIFTKCPQGISQQEMRSMQKKASAYFKKEAIYFSGIQYDLVSSKLDRTIKRKIVIVTGIANPSVMLEYLESDYEVVKHFNFPDHHQFTEKEIDEVNAFATANHADVICTEKDWVRIISDKQLENVLGDKLFYLPMMVQFLEGEEALEKQLNGLINNQDKTTN
ncbi:tetraacyldisaccharide 4'-kinase [Marivirga atlantica]|jgi:tetraacyldisaccharide 4'-kinase|uniref:Tetraacyldisaccharide 4'-kinase n=1 Tax=Marivirga atlantica TaxID=1548457 RepID=A0A937APM6_9BACT|nr:tetraacyldisaccharide 4'-kinase [Marivirga atlantica]MBL0766512.1 tetraacyldisaccharide 4'-kinase [Marivirga atlantica]